MRVSDWSRRAMWTVGQTLDAPAVYIGANLLADIGAVLLNPRLRTLSE